MKKLTSTLILVVFAFFCKAQMVVTTPVSPTDLVQNHLLGSGVYMSNPTVVGSAHSRGSFTGGPAGIVNGIILSSGDLSTGPWAPASFFRSSAMLGNNDPTLDSLLVGQTTFDASVLEFDFKVGSDSVKFDFIFGSEEYNDYVNTSFNDAFGFFISGPGIVGEKNIALIPGTTIPVSINNVNNGGPYGGASLGPCTNCAYFHDNIGDTTFAFDAYTTVLTAQEAVLPCTVYHIKLVVADVADQIFDSFVMLADNSFQACSIPRLYVNTVPIIADTLRICAGTSIQISSLQAPNYLWSTGETTQTITITQSGNYAASVFEGTCYVTSKSVYVDVLNLPTAPVISNNGGQLISTVIDPLYTYAWYYEGALINGATAPTYNVNSGGCYQLFITDVNGCSISSNLLCLTFTGIDYIANDKVVRVMPNPFKHSTVISFANAGNEKVNVTVYDATGRSLSNSKFKINNSGNNEIELTNKSLENGIYFFELRNRSNQILGKGKFVID